MDLSIRNIQGPGLVAAIIVALAALFLGGVSFAFKGAVSF